MSSRPNGATTLSSSFSRLAATACGFRCEVQHQLGATREHLGHNQHRIFGELDGSIWTLRISSRYAPVTTGSTRRGATSLKMSSRGAQRFWWPRQQPVAQVCAFFLQGIEPAGEGFELAVLLNRVRDPMNRTRELLNPKNHPEVTLFTRPTRGKLGSSKVLPPGDLCDSRS